ncbi:hypothetical protein ACWEJ6_48900 [Nonomuraea sp. NPDC004702]
MFGPRLGFVVAGLASGLAGVVRWLIIGLYEGEHHAWQPLCLARVWLTFRHQPRWRLMNFLDDSHRLGLSRAVGPVFQFRHAAQYDHLAAETLTSHLPPDPRREDGRSPFNLLAWAS